MDATTPTDWSWLGPQHRAAPAEALARIEAICAQHPELSTAALVVLATHQGLPREVVAAAIKRYRHELDAFEVADVVSMLNAMQNGAREAFDAVRRTRRSAQRSSAGGLAWVPNRD